jgi:hypothetical protein
METERFALAAGPDGEVFASTWDEASIARRIAGVYEMAPGGMIVMSTDVNATAGRGFLGWAKGFLKTQLNRWMKDSRVDEELRRLVEERGVDTGWSIGNLFRGRFMSPKSGKKFDEKSFAVDIRGVPFDFVKAAAEVLRRKFSQEGVLVVDHANGKTYYMD